VECPIFGDVGVSGVLAMIRVCQGPKVGRLRSVGRCGPSDLATLCVILARYMGIGANLN